MQLLYFAGQKSTPYRLCYRTILKNSTVLKFCLNYHLNWPLLPSRPFAYWHLLVIPHLLLWKYHIFLLAQASFEGIFRFGRKSKTLGKSLIFEFFSIFPFSLVSPISLIQKNYLICLKYPYYL